MHSSLWRGDRDLTRQLLRHGGAVKMRKPGEGASVPYSMSVSGGHPIEQTFAPDLPAGDPIDYASAELKRLLVKQTAANAAAEEAVVRFY